MHPPEFKACGRKIMGAFRMWKRWMNWGIRKHSYSKWSEYGRGPGSWDLLFTLFNESGGGKWWTCTVVLYLSMGPEAERRRNTRRTTWWEPEEADHPSEQGHMWSMKMFSNLNVCHTLIGIHKSNRRRLKTTHSLQEFHCGSKRGHQRHGLQVVQSSAMWREKRGFKMERLSASLFGRGGKGYF